MSSAAPIFEVKDDRGVTKGLALAIEAPERTRQALRRFWFAVGKDLRAELLRATKQKRTPIPGVRRVYVSRTATGRRRRHVASAPGESHASRVGMTLAKSADFKVQGTHTMFFGYGARATRPMPRYGPFVEEGTVRMAARPSLRNALNKGTARVNHHWRQASRKEFKFS